MNKVQYKHPECDFTFGNDVKYIEHHSNSIKYCTLFGKKIPACRSITEGGAEDVRKPRKRTDLKVWNFPFQSGRLLQKAVRFACAVIFEMAGWGNSRVCCKSFL